MDIFVRNIPPNASIKELEKHFRGPLAAFRIYAFAIDKTSGKTFANLTMPDEECGLHFLASYGDPTHPLGRSTKRLFFGNKPLYFSKSRYDADPFKVRALQYEASQCAFNASTTVTTHANGAQNKRVTRFAFQGLQCGTWDYFGTHLAFIQHFSDGKQGSVSFGLNGAVILLGGTDSTHCRVDINYHDCANIVLGDYHEPTVTFTLQLPPKFYQIDAEDPLAAALRKLTLGPATASAKRAQKTRTTSINERHTEKVAGTCLVYRITLLDYTLLSTVRSLLSRNPKTPSAVSMSTVTRWPSERLDASFQRLDYELTDMGRYGKLPFNLLYQTYRLARNGALSPLMVQELLPKISEVSKRYGLDAAQSTLRRFYRSVPIPGPDTGPNEFSKQALEQVLDDLAAAYEQYQYSPENPYQLVKRHTHINLIHKIVITPAGIFLEGPEPEPTNRVLRRYADHIDSFVRMVFQDEDGCSLRYDPRAKQDLIFHKRFKDVLDTNILIAGRAFSFLGFSHSSLRAQSCWFMAPIFREENFRIPEQILKELGNFESIRVPAKCAARIGQNFTDTNATVDLGISNVLGLDMIQRNGYDFSDGVGTISEGLLRRVWRVYGTRRNIKPTALQIRFQGYKGMVSLDTRLRGDLLKLRPNMNKFEAPDAWNLEICGAAFKPLPMILNRQLIKILEDLGVPATVFVELQSAAVNRLRDMVKFSPINSVSFLEETDAPRATRMPSLIRLLHQIGLDYRQDSFLYSVVEMAVVTKLRDIKYRGRIPVGLGHTLYGIMDETGYLQEGEVYVVTESSPSGGRRVLVQNGVVVSRSPALHPGDVQVVNAVDVPPQSPLARLSNVIVFSQHGYRDLPSQLSGGDLDGDLYNVIQDRRLFPRSIYRAAEYPRISAQALDRAVTRKDMSDFLIHFMESDQLGMLCNVHLQLADQHDSGTFHHDCIKLANMASTAVDFSKTGIPVDIRDCPKYNRCRPDFMAPSPRVVVSDKGQMGFEEQDNEDDEAFEDLDAERRGFRYYKSEKVLGQLYRDIDERQFLLDMQEEQRSIMDSMNTASGLLHKLVEYAKRLAAQYGVLYAHHRDLAVEIRAGYEESLTEILHFYAPSVHSPLSEHEAFAGTILGRKGGAQSKPLRELSKTMRERFDAIVEYTVMRIVKGDEQMRGVGDLDLLYADSLDREVEALPRAIACLSVAVEERGSVDRHLGELQSFKYIAAGVCLREIERYRITTFGSYVLPTV